MVNRSHRGFTFCRFTSGIKMFDNNSEISMVGMKRDESDDCYVVVNERGLCDYLEPTTKLASRWRPIQIRSPRGGDGVVLATATGTTPGAGQCVAILRPPAKSVLVKPPPRRNCTTRFRTFSLLFSFFFPPSFVFIVFLLVFPDCFGSWKELSEASWIDRKSMVSVMACNYFIRLVWTCIRRYLCIC